ncbi:MAG: sigma-70 family RNA polymerase sigma factor [Clostridia bacterium]|nr:sigma-70 family RNA polymerase sigma factor [Clostridia bacterium]
MDNLQLSELAQKAKNGDMAAFEKLYVELSPEIYAIACEITKNKEESRDLMQDCFVAAMENISTLNEPEKIKNWLIRIAANKSRDYIKKKKPSALTEDQYEIIDNIEDEDISVIPEASLETEERIEDVNEILGCLTEEKRLCLLLRFRYDMSYAEIANELGITESAVKSRISRAKDDIEKEAEKWKKKGLPLFGIAPFGLVIFALKRSADITAAAFAGSAAQTAAFAGVTAASQAGIAAASTAATATTAASATASAAGTTATAATGIGAKVAAMSVAQKVVAGITAATIATGSATVTTVVVKNKIEAREETTTAYVEQVTTAPDYGFESETVFIPAVAETESSTAEYSTNNKSTTVTQSKETEKSTVANNTTTKSTTKANTTTQKQTTTTTKPQTTTTTKSETTKKETTTEEVTTTPTTTKTVTTTKAITTTTTTESASPATVTVKVYSAGSGSEYKTYNLTFDSGVTLSDSDIESGLMSQHGIDAMADSFSVTTEPGGNYTATAYEI